MAGEILQPVELIIPIRNNITPSANNVDGNFWLSGGALHWVSGSSIMRVLFTGSAISGSRLT